MVMAGKALAHSVTRTITSSRTTPQSAGVRFVKRPVAILRKGQKTAAVVTAAGRRLSQIKLAAIIRLTGQISYRTNSAAKRRSAAKRLIPRAFFKAAKTGYTAFELCVPS